MRGDARDAVTEPSTAGDEPSAATPPAHVDHFTIERPLGAGGMGLVFAARDVALGRSVALKLVHPRAGEPRHHERLVREAQALAKLSHPNVVTVYEVGEVDGRVFIAMELIDGSTLRDWIATPRPWREIAARFLAAGRGLAAVHAIGLVHRDFKPSNVFLDRGGAIKVGDFGLVAAQGDAARAGDDEPAPPPAARSLTTTGAVLGTPAYMAPEQVRGETVDARADQYSFCVSLREALTGVSPADDLHHPPGRPVPRPLRRILERGLDVDASRRYPSMNDLLADLERVQRPRTSIWVAAVAAVAAAGIAAAVFLAREPSRAGGPAAAAPSPPAIPPAAEKLAAEIARLDDVQRGGEHQGLLERVTAVVADARAIDHGPTLVAALHLLATVQTESGDAVGGAATLREITQVAAASHEDEQAARAWLKLVLTVGYDLGRPDEAMGLLAAAEAAVVRAGSPLELRTKLLYYTAQLYNSSGKAGEGLAKLEEAKRLLVDAGASKPGSPIMAFLGDIAYESASSHAARGDHDRAIASCREAIAIYREAHGVDHPDEAYAWHEIGEQLRVAGRPGEAVQAFREAIRIREGKQGETPNLAISLVALATALEESDDWDQALAVLDRAVAMSREQMAPDDPSRMNALIALAEAYGHQRRWRDKTAIEDEVIAAFERTGAKSTNLPITLFNRGETEAAQGRWVAAVEWYDRSIAAFEAIEGPQFHRLVFPLEAKGRALLAQKRPAEALAPLERALALSVPGQGRAEQASARFHRGRAIVESVLRDAHSSKP